MPCKRSEPDVAGGRPGASWIKVLPFLPCYLLLICYLISSPASVESDNLFACALHNNCPSWLMPAAPPQRMSRELQGEHWRSILPTKLVATATSLEGSKKILRVVHLRPKFYQSCKFRKDRSCRCWDNWCDRNRKKIFKNKTAAEHKPSAPALRAEPVG